MISEPLRVTDTLGISTSGQSGQHPAQLLCKTSKASDNSVHLTLKPCKIRHRAHSPLLVLSDGSSS